MIKTKLNVKFERERVNSDSKLENINLFNFGQRMFFMCLLVFIFGLSFTAKASAATYYVDCNAANDTGDGTSTETAWKTIAKVNSSSFSSDDRVLFNRDCTWREQLIVPSSGTDEHPITFGDYGSGNKPRIISPSSYRINNSSVAQMWESGASRLSTTGYSPNGDFEVRTLNDFSNVGEIQNGTGTVTAETTNCYHGATCVKLTGGSGYGRISLDAYYLAPNQKYEISYWVKSDSAGTATARLYETTNGLANTKTDGTYQTWTGHQNISDLSVLATDTGWTEKKITILTDGANHTPGLQITTGNASSVWIDYLTVRPIWTQYATNVYSIGYDATQTGTPYVTSFSGVHSAVATDQDSLSGTKRWFVRTISGGHNRVFYVYSSLGSPETSSENLDIVTGTNIKTIDLNDKNYIIVENLDIGYGYYNIANPGNNVVVQNNDIHNSLYPVYIDANNFILRGNNISYGDWGVNINSSDGVLIENNIISHMIKLGIANEGGAIAPSVVSGNITNLVVQNNTISDCESYGIAEYGTDSANKISGAVYRYNDISDCLYGVWSMSMPNGINNSKFYYNKIYQPKSGDSIGVRIYRAGNSIYLYNNSVFGFKYGIEMWNGVNSLTVKNNIIANSATFNIYDRSDNSIGTFDHNIYYPVSSGTFDYHGNDTLDFSGWKAVSSQDANSISSNPLFVSSSNYYLQPTSSAINAGTDISLTTDYTGTSHIYGLPDIGAYEYQPTQISGTNKIDIGAGARIYGDGKFMPINSTSGTTADLSINPAGNDTTKWLDILPPTGGSVIIWEANHKKWKESSDTLGVTNTLHTVGDLENNKYYNVKVDDTLATANITGADCTDGVCKANEAGKITFTYTGGYSSHTFDVSTGDNTPPAVTNDTNPKFHTDTTEVSLSLITDENSTCHYSTDQSDAYADMTAFFTTGTTAHSTAVTSLTPGEYTYYAICQDGVGNDTPYTLTFQIAARENDTGTSDAKLETDGNNETLDEDKKIYFDEDNGRLKGQDDTIANGTVKIYKEGKKYATVDVGSDGSWSKKLSFGHNKTYALKLKFYDQYGTLRDEKEYDVKIDTEKPVFTDPFSKTLNIRKDYKINFPATDNTGIGYYKIQVLDSLGHVARAWRKQTKSFYLVSESIIDQADTIIVRAYDKAGNYAEEEVSLNIGENQIINTGNNVEANNSSNEQSNQQADNKSKPNICSYTVVSGDTLWSIAKTVYGDVTQYQRIIDLNKDKYTDIESKLSIGQELTLCDSSQTLQNTVNNSNSGNTNQQIQTQNQQQTQPETKTFKWWNPFSWF